jgi:hypothetical protein
VEGPRKGRPNPAKTESITGDALQLQKYFLKDKILSTYVVNSYESLKGLSREIDFKNFDNLRKCANM